ncbi:MAG: SRPBCC family protein [Micromonosporaceae bacterium]
MKLEHGFTVPVPVDRAWDVLLDLPQVAPCMPGAALTSYEGDEFTGTVKVKLGPINLTYQGQGRIAERDSDNRRAVIEASGKERRGGGTAKAMVTAELRPEGDGSTRVDVVTDLAITGRPAQFGRGMMVDVGNKLIGQFADCLSGKLTGGEGLEGAQPGGATVAGGATPAAGAGASARGSSTAPMPPAPTAPSNGAVTSNTAGPSKAAGPPKSAGPSQTGHPGAASGAVPAAAPGAAAMSRPAATPGPMEHEIQPIDLLEVTGARDVAKRVATYAVAFVAGLLVGWLIFRGGRGGRGG